MLKKILFYLFIGVNCLRASYTDFFQYAESQVPQEHHSVLPLLYHDFLDHLSSAEHPLLIAIGGSPGAGKSTICKRFSPHPNVHLHNMDEVLSRLPGYQEDVVSIGAKKAFEKWWRIARELSEVLVHYAIQSKYNITYDRTCGAEGTYEDFYNAKKQGYYILLIGLHVDHDIAKKRVLKREEEGGPAISEDLLTEYRCRFSALWPHYLKLVDDASLFLNNSGKPLLIFSSKQGIIDESLYLSFLKEGDSFHDFFAQKLANTTGFR